MQRPEGVELLVAGMRFVMGVASVVVLIWAAWYYLAPPVARVVAPAFSVFQ